MFYLCLTRKQSEFNPQFSHSFTSVLRTSTGPRSLGVTTDDGKQYCFVFFKHTWTGLFVCFFTSVTPKSHRWRFGDVYRVAWMFRAVVNKDGRCCQKAHIISLTTNSMFGFMCREEIATHSFSKLSSPSPTSLRGIALLWLVILISALQAFKRS